MEYEIRLYRSVDGKCPFLVWLEDLRDNIARHQIQMRLDRLRLGNLGNCKSLGSGIYELKIDYGPGYRIYFTFVEKEIVLLMVGGIKRTQTRDIEKAKLYLADFKVQEKWS